MPPTKRRLSEDAGPNPKSSRTHEPPSNAEDVDTSATAAETSLRTALDDAAARVDALMRHDYPQFARAVHVGWFAIAARKAADTTGVCGNWLSRQFLELREMTFEEPQDYVGPLIAAALLASETNHLMTRTIMFTAYRTPGNLLDGALEEFGAPALGHMSPETRGGVERMWASCAAARQLLLSVVQRTMVHVFNDRGVTVDQGVKLWKEMRAAVLAGQPIRRMVSVVDGCSPSRFKENFAALRTLLEESGHALSASSTEQWCLNRLPQPKIGVTGFEDFFQTCESELHRYYESGSRFKEAPEYVRDGMDSLKQCIEERKAAIDEVDDLCNRRRMIECCNIELLDDLGKRLDEHLKRATSLEMFTEGIA